MVIVRILTKWEKILPIPQNFYHRSSLVEPFWEILRHFRFVETFKILCKKWYVQSCGVTPIAELVVVCRTPSMRQTWLWIYISNALLPPSLFKTWYILILVLILTNTFTINYWLVLKLGYGFTFQMHYYHQVYLKLD